MGLAAATFDFMRFGQTVLQKGSFFGGSWFMGMLGAEGLAAPMESQACATGARLSATAMGECLQGAEQLLIVVWPFRLGTKSITFRVDGVQDGVTYFDGAFTCVFIIADQFKSQAAPEHLRALIEPHIPS
jgi:hypothetical protein